MRIICYLLHHSIQLSFIQRTFYMFVGTYIYILTSVLISFLAEWIGFIRTTKMQMITLLLSPYNIDK